MSISVTLSERRGMSWFYSPTVGRLVLRSVSVG
jgi:hypothetical protein